MSLEKSKGAFLCLQGRIHEKEKTLSARTPSGQDALSLDLEFFAGLGTGADSEGAQSVSGDLVQDHLDMRQGVPQFH